MSYLQAYRAFTLPSKGLCREPIRCYYFYVHPMFPIVDAECFLNDFSEKGPSKTKPLLLWSMILIASSVIIPVPTLSGHCAPSLTSCSSICPKNMSELQDSLTTGL